VLSKHNEAEKQCRSNEMVDGTIMEFRLWTTRTNIVPEYYTSLCTRQNSGPTKREELVHARTIGKTARSRQTWIEVPRNLEF
jgi:hypothetical protein